MPDKTLRFDWQEENKNNRDSFLAWMLPSVMADHELDAMPEGWTDHVEMEIILNGVKVDATHFIDSLERNYGYATIKAAERILAERVPDALQMDEVFDMLYDANRAIRRAVNEYCVALGRELGVTIYRDEEL